MSMSKRPFVNYNIPQLLVSDLLLLINDGAVSWSLKIMVFNPRQKST